ncbi:MAG: PAS domain S-box protein [Desulfosalsimonadaceae bacterium]
MRTREDSNMPVYPPDPIAELNKQLAQSEKARREAEEKYRLIAENMREVISTLDRNLIYTYISPSVKHTRGFEPEELIGQPLSWAITPACRETTEKLFSGRELKPKPNKDGSDPVRRVELEMVRKDGSTIWSESWVSLLRDETGRHTGYLNVSRDIDEKKKVNGQLRESEEKFRSLAEACPYGILIYQDDHWVYTNPAGEKISGYPAEDLYRMKFWEIVHPEHRDMVRERGLKRQAGEKVPPAYDFKILGREGAVRWISLTGANCFYQGRPAGMITVCDITEQKQKEQALRESEEKYRAIIDNIEEGYYEVDTAGDFTFFNEQICVIAGCAHHEIEGVNYRAYTTPADAKRLLRTFRRIFQTEKPVKAFDLQICRPDGEIRHVEISASLISDPSGGAAGFRGIMRDITDRKKAEEERERLEAQLMHAHKMEAVGTLAGGVAHDFNNILQAINGYTQLLMMNRAPDDPDSDKLMQLEKAGERASGLVRQLLTFSRKVAGERRPVHLNREIMSAQKLLKQTLPKMIDIRLVMEENLWVVNADPLHMEQILLNLASNAADAMPDGGRLTIETQNVVLDESYCSDHVESVPGKYVLLMVSDTGSGMNPETRRHIFDPFYTTKAVGKGTGLGLASVYGIVREHGGLINCYSEPGQGAVFRIYLPASFRKEDAVEENDSPLVPPAGGKEGVLVIDDEATVREMAKEMLEYYGYRVLCAEDGERALDMYRENASNIDLIILDLNMPGMGGYKCMQKLLEIDPEARILIASGYSTDHHAQQALRSGAADFIGKPYRLQEMARKVRSALDDDG